MFGESQVKVGHPNVQGSGDHNVPGDGRVQGGQGCGDNSEQMVQSGDDQNVQGSGDQNVPGDRGVQSDRDYGDNTEQKVLSLKGQIEEVGCEQNVQTEKDTKGEHVSVSTTKQDIGANSDQNVQQMISNEEWPKS